MFFNHKKESQLRKRQIDLEDILLEDTDKQKENIHEERVAVPLEKIALSLPFILAIIFFGLVFIRVIYLQVKGNYYQNVAEKSRSQAEWLLPHRGIVYDRNQIQLVHNIPVYSLLFKTAQKPENNEEMQSLLAQISVTFNISETELRQKIESENNQPLITLKENLATDEVFTFKSQKEKWTMLDLKLRETRDYLGDQALSHILGYVGKITEEEYKRKGSGYLLDDYIGKNGIELQYEDILRGKLGIKNTEISSVNHATRPINSVEAVDGVNIALTLDYELQKKLYETFRSALQKTGSQSGAAIAINPQNGEILAQVSFPSFNNNQLSQGITQEELNRLINSNSRPFFNRAIGGTYPPGSTFKPLIALAALEENIVTPQTNFNCPGYLRIPNVYNAQLDYYFRDWKIHGTVNLKKALAESCNVYFYTIGGGYENFVGLGIKRIKTYAQKLRLDQKTGIDFPGEATGFIPDPAWKKQVKKENWYIGDTYHASIGQGDISLSPLDVAQLYGFIANGGTLYKPHFLHAIEETPGGNFNKIDPETLPSPALKKENIDIVHAGLREAVLSGSAQLLKNLPVSSAAKTGTAQFGDGSDTHAWFVAFAPYENPEIVLVVLVEQGGGGSATAAPIADEVLKWYFDEKLKTQN